MKMHSYAALQRQPTLVFPCEYSVPNQGVFNVTFAPFDAASEWRLSQCDDDCDYFTRNRALKVL